MSDARTDMTATAVNEAVTSFQNEAKAINDALDSVNSTISGVNSNTESVWIKGYAQQFAGIFATEVADAVATINESAGKLEEIAAAITAEDAN